MRPDTDRDLVLEAFAHRRRQAIVARLQQAPGGTTVGELEEYLQERSLPDSAPAARRRRIHTSLEHVHLPKLAEADVIEYDGSAGRVASNRPVGLRQSDKVRVLSTLTSTPPHRVRADGGTDRRVDPFIDALASRRRQRVVACLTSPEHDGWTEVDELVGHLHDGSTAGEPRRRLATALRHVHLPALADGGIVDYRAAEGTVRLQDSQKLQLLVESDVLAAA